MNDDAFTFYDSRGNGHGHGPHVPEPATYGLFFLAALLCVAWMRRRKG